MSRAEQGVADAAVRPTRKDPLGILTDDEWDVLHADLAEMARQRRRAEQEAAWLPMA